MLNPLMSARGGSAPPSSRCYTAGDMTDRMERIRYRCDLPQKYMGVLQTSAYDYEYGLRPRDSSNVV